MIYLSLFLFFVPSFFSFFFSSSNTNIKIRVRLVCWSAFIKRIKKMELFLTQSTNFFQFYL
jgi:hypothetical protein